MAASRTSLALTDVYRDQLQQTKQTLEAQCRSFWPLTASVPDRRGVDLDKGYEAFLTRMVPALAAAQGQAVRLSYGYLSAFLTSELGGPAEAITSQREYVGVSRDGHALRDALRGPVITVKLELRQGRDLARAMQRGLTRALRILGMEFDHAARRSLQDAIVADPRVTGYRRAVRGTCAACLATASGTFDGNVHFPVHPSCQCVTEPVVRNVKDRFPRPTGEQIFAAKTAAEQDAAIGKQAAEAVRTGLVTLTALVEVQRQAAADDIQTQKPLSALP